MGSEALEGGEIDARGRGRWSKTPRGGEEVGVGRLGG